jgi:hypothetical protein
MTMLLRHAVVGKLHEDPSPEDVVRTETNGRDAAVARAQQPRRPAQPYVVRDARADDQRQRPRVRLVLSPS